MIVEMNKITLKEIRFKKLKGLSNVTIHGLAVNWKPLTKLSEPMVFPHCFHLKSITNHSIAGHRVIRLVQREMYIILE